MGAVRVVLFVAALVLSVAACSSGNRSSESTTTATLPTTTTAEHGPLRLKLIRIATGLEAPLDVTSAPGETDRLYVVEQPGRIVTIDGGKVSQRPFLDITRDVVSGGEQGLL